MKKIISTLLFFLSTTVWASPTKITVALDWYINPDHSTLLIAQQKGYFKEQGLEVQFIAPEDPEQLVAANQAQVAVSYQSHLLLDVAAGMPLMRIATLINHPLNCIAVLASSNITTLSQLKGKKIGYSGSAIEASLLRVMFAYHGLRVSDLTLVNVNTNLIQALLSKKIDAVSGMMRNVEPIQLAQMGYNTHLFLPEQNGVPDYDELILVVNKKNVNQPWVKPFVAALQQAVDYIHAHPQQSWQLAAKGYSDALAPAMQMARDNHAIWNATLPYLDLHPGALDVASYQRFEEFMLKQGLLKTNLTMSDYAISP